jgi:ABC-type multidrug transport system ATPase subunit
MSRSGPAVAQKTALAAALLSGPEVLLLDEPLRAVDPDERRRLLRLPEKRLTMVLASRYPASEEGLVNQVVLLRDGRVALHAAIEDLAGAGLPLSLRGIEELAQRRASQVRAPRPALAAAEATAR